MISVTGRIVDEDGAVQANLTVEARGEWLLTTSRLAGTTTDAEGRFALQVREILDFAELPRPFQLRVTDITKRLVMADRELNGSVTNHDLGDITVRRADRFGLQVTQLTGHARFVSEGNALKLLIDGEEAFGRIAAELEAVAKDTSAVGHSIDITQLFFTVPGEFQRDPTKEKPSLIFRFTSPVKPSDPLRPNQPPPRPRLTDVRPERLILTGTRSHTGMPVRILLNQPKLGWPEGAFWLTVVGALAVGIGIGLFAVGVPSFFIFLGLGALGLTATSKITNVLRNKTHVDEMTAYFAAAIADAAPAQPKISIRGFQQAIPDHGVLHCKLLLVDEKRAVVLGSPFEQDYFDDAVHKIDDPRRGDHEGFIQHDVSIAAVGPTVHDLHETMRLFWNEDLDADSTERLGESAVPPKETSGEDGVATVQVIRTLSGGRFKSLDKRSEKGTLEAYLRAFANARAYIYLETQYFTDSVITGALVEVLKTRDVELILMINIRPDVILYPRRQSSQIDKLRAAGGARVGAFTRWSYDGLRPNNARPWIAPVYLHSKVGVVDDSWATIGSANLDGLSLDHNLLLSPVVFGETMAAEVNLSILPPDIGDVTPVAKLLRRRLFAEHLGLILSDGTPDPILDKRPANGWLAGLWRPRAKAALQHVKEARRENLRGCILEYPPDAGSVSTPRKHLAALGVDVRNVSASVVRPILWLREFDFSTGLWDRKPELEDFDT